MMMRELKSKSYSSNYYDTVEDKAEESSESRLFLIRWERTYHNSDHLQSDDQDVVNATGVDGCGRYTDGKSIVIVYYMKIVQSCGYICFMNNR